MLLPNSFMALQASTAGQPICAGLSNDYLNRYSELLMLIETAGDDRELADQLRGWKPIGYRSYFAVSPLRCAGAALAAYDALPEERRLVFEKLVRAMDQLAAMAILALDIKDDQETAAFVPAATAPILRRLIARASSFLRSGGVTMDPAGAVEEAQETIDRLMSCVPASDEAA
jgi:hypothetical protein